MSGLQTYSLHVFLHVLCMYMHMHGVPCTLVYISGAQRANLNIFLFISKYACALLYDCDNNATLGAFFPHKQHFNLYSTATCTVLFDLICV